MFIRKEAGVNHQEQQKQQYTLLIKELDFLPLATVCHNINLQEAFDRKK